MRSSLQQLTSTVERACQAGHAQILRCHPLHIVDGRPTPFPTLFWLACPDLDRQLSELERRGWIALLQSRILADDQLSRRIAADHRAYIEQRWSLLSVDDRQALRAHGLEDNLRRRGIGGILDFQSVKCLHLHYAHHLAGSNTIGELIELEGLLEPCGG